MLSLSRSGALYRTLRLARNRSVIVSKRLGGVHPTASIHPSSHVCTDLEAHEYAFVGRDCTIAPRVTIGRYTMLASNVAIVGDDHNWHDPAVPMQFAGRPVQRATRIGADVWLGHGVSIMRGVSIGDGAVVAAGAIVTTDVPAREVWAGVPARKLRDRFNGVTENEVHAAMVVGPIVRPAFAEALERYDNAEQTQRKANPS